MLSAKTISALAGISKATRKPGVRVKHLFRVMTHSPDLWMSAYMNIYANNGAVTKGIDNNTLDGMCRDRIENLIKLLKDGRFKPKPVRRVYIPKKNGKRRPLGVPTGDDKLVQEVVRLLLERVYESIFSDRSHGFRKARSCHTALEQIQTKWKGSKWFVEMDIQGFYDNIDHCKMVDILEKKIDDRRFIAVIKLFLRAGYLENWKFHGTYSGTPQGGICSPMLANIYLHELDKSMEKMIQQYDRGDKRRINPKYHRLKKQKERLTRRVRNAELTGDVFPWFKEELQSEIDAIDDNRRKQPHGDPLDENYRRLHYVRYADDFVLGLVGPRTDAEAIMTEIRRFLSNDLSLSVAEEKSGIRHASDGVIFLGHQVIIPANRRRLKRHKCGTTKDGKAFYATARSLNSHVDLRIPRGRVYEFCRNKRLCNSDYYPVRRDNLLHLSDYEIVSTINAELRGFANFYAMTHQRPLHTLEQIGLRSLFKTLGNNHKCSGVAMARRMKFEDEHYLTHTRKGKVRRLKVWKLKHHHERERECRDQEPHPMRFAAMTELSERLDANECEYCKKRGGYFEIHHVRKLSDIRRKKAKAMWEILLQSRNRKTLVLCVECHQQLHKGELPNWKRDLHT